MGFIYALICPESNGIRYIGQTKRTLNIRLAQHISTCQQLKKRYSHKEQWLRKLISSNLINNLQILLIEDCCNDLLNEREIYWIDYYKSSCDLTNGTIGGTYNKPLVGELNPNYRKKLPEHQLEKLRNRIGINNPNYGNHASPSIDIIEKRRLCMINSEKFQQSRKSEEYKKKISDSKSRTVCLLDQNYKIVSKYKNATIAAEALGFTRGNITNAIRFKRQIGKQSLQKHWVCYEQDFELFTQISKDSTFAP